MSGYYYFDSVSWCTSPVWLQTVQNGNVFDQTSTRRIAIATGMNSRTARLIKCESVNAAGQIERNVAP